MSDKQIIVMNRVGWKREEHNLSRLRNLRKTGNPSGVGAWFITFRNLRETNNHSDARKIAPGQQTERDKSRSYACRQIYSKHSDILFSDKIVYCYDRYYQVRSTDPLEVLLKQSVAVSVMPKIQKKRLLSQAPFPIIIRY